MMDRGTPKTLTAIYQTKSAIFFSCIEKEGMCIFVMVLKYDRVSTLY